jgi:ATP-dependent Clp protease adaptor protein ClpS
MTTDIATEIEEEIKETVLHPTNYKVIFMNDEVTPMDFVVEVLIQIFRHSQATAQDLTMKIHEKGSAVAGVYSYEIAEQKAVETTKLSREHGFPLQVAIEKE